MPVIGCGATAIALQAVAEGTMLGTVLNDADAQGKAVFGVAHALATGKNPATVANITDGNYVWVPYQKVTKP
jgi:methyl-galactoside transport system substrate-binding protein